MKPINSQNLSRMNKVIDKKSILFFFLQSLRQEEDTFDLEKIFKKTKTVPSIYYLPVSEEIAQERKKKLKENKI